MMIITSVGLQNTAEKTRKMILAGTDAIRFNFSRRSPKQNIEFIKIVQEVANELNSNVKILVDMPINKVRIGDFEIKTFAVRENEEFVCRSASYSPDCNEFIPIHTVKLGEKVNLNQTITIGDGEIAVQVLDIIDSETIKIRILNNGAFQYMKTFNINYGMGVENLFSIYQDILQKITEFEPEYIAVSYINKKTNAYIKQMPTLRGQDNRRKVIIKIETQSGIDDVEEIMQDPFYDMVLLDRGEIGVNTGFSQVGCVQKNICALAKKHKKRLIISTQILESTINSFIPSRADILDLTNIVLEDAYGIMFCRETGLNTRPAYTISVAKKIIAEAEKYKQSLSL